MRLIDEFLARSGVPRCQKDIKETADVIAKVTPLGVAHGLIFVGGIPHVLERDCQRIALERRREGVQVRSRSLLCVSNAAVSLSICLTQRTAS